MVSARSALENGTLKGAQAEERDIFRGVRESCVEE